MPLFNVGLSVELVVPEAVPAVAAPLLSVGLNDVPVVSQSVETLEGVDVPEAVVLPIVVDVVHGLRVPSP